MEPVSLITIVAGVLGALSATGGLASVVLKLVHSMKAERDFKARVTAGVKAALEADFGGHLASGTVAAPMLTALSSRLVELIQGSEMSKERKEALLSGLLQPSEVGKERYAVKLYSTLAAPDESTKSL
jgi:flagellar motor component MotA